MKHAFLAGLLLAATADGFADEPARFQVFGAAGLGLGTGSLKTTHLAIGSGYGLGRHISAGVDLGYSYVPLADQARGGGNRAYWGLATLTAHPLSSAKVSPYFVVGYGRGRFAPSYRRSDSGKTAAAGVGLQVRLNPRASLFIEGRLAMMGGITAADGLHMELPVRVGFRYRPGQHH